MLDLPHTAPRQQTLGNSFGGTENMPMSAANNALVAPLAMVTVTFGEFGWGTHAQFRDGEDVGARGTGAAKAILGRGLRSQGATITVTLMLYGEAALTVACRHHLSELG
jgi:hypothetical protein